MQITFVVLEQIGLLPPPPVPLRLLLNDNPLRPTARLCFTDLAVVVGGGLILDGDGPAITDGILVVADGLAVWDGPPIFEAAVKFMSKLYRNLLNEKLVI